MRVRVLFAFVATGCGGAPGTTATGDTGFVPAVPTDDWPEEWRTFEDEVLRLVNLERFVGGRCGSEWLPPSDPLEMDEVLRGVARTYSQQMAQQGFFDHVDPMGRDPGDRVDAAGFTGAAPIGENIAQGYPTPEQVMAGWMSSPGHCSNILEASYGVIGIGYYLDERDPYGHVWTQNFAGSH